MTNGHPCGMNKLVRIGDPRVKLILPKITPEQNRDLWRWRNYKLSLTISGIGFGK